MQIIMKTFVVFCLAVNFAAFALGLQCYFCPEGTSGQCENTQGCSNGDNACLKLDSDERTYTKCINYANCDFMNLAANTTFSKFTYSCCQSDLCNANDVPKKGLFQWLKEKLG